MDTAGCAKDHKHRIFWLGVLYAHFILLTITVLFGSTAAPAASAEVDSYTGMPEGEYRFGVFPYLSPIRLEQIYAPAGAAFQRATGSRFHFRTATTFKHFFKRLAKGHYDLVLIQPFWYPPAVDQFNYIPLVRMSEPFTSLIVVPDNSPLRTVSDLEGKVIATPPAFVPVVHMARKALTDLGLIPDEKLTLRAFKSVDSCFQQVFVGKADACISPPFAPAVVEEKMQVKLRVLLETPGIPNLTLLAHPRLPEEQREIIRQQVLGWPNDPKGKQILSAMKTSHFIPAMDSDYAAVRELVRAIKEKKP